MSARRITRNRLVAIIGGSYSGRDGITVERSFRGDWLIKFKTLTGNFEDWVAPKHIKPPA